MRNKRSHRDVAEIHQHEHEEDLDARRVFVVNDSKIDLQVDTSKVTDAIMGALKNVKFDMNKNEPQTIIIPEIVTIEKQVFVPQVETKIVEVPVITKEIEIVTIEKPIITEIIKLVEIEKPIFIEKIQDKVPAWCWALIFSQTLAVGGILWHFLQKGV